MINRGRIAGIRRRIFRTAVRRRVRKGRASRRPGRRSLSGYGFGMRFPDELIWANQFLEIFGCDCYGVGRLGGDPVVIDGGANIGTFACWIKWLRPQAHVIAVEPCRESIEYLRKNLQNASKPDVTVVEAALGRETNRSVMIGGEFSDCMRTTEDSGQAVAVVPLADLIGDHVDLLKLDVEGAELDALLSAGDGLRRVHRTVLEYHQYRDNDTRLSQVIAVLEEHGFDRFSVSDQRDLAWDDPGLPDYCCLLEAARSCR